MCPMDLLPFELLCQIFDYLDLESVKNASLTCQRWEQVIFSNQYIKRFVLYVALFRRSIPSPVHNTSFLSKNSAKHEMKQMARLLNASNRCYPNLTLEFDHRSEFTDHAFHVLFGILSTHKLDQLVVLKLILKADPDLMLLMVVNAVPKMSRLHALHITLGNEYQFDLSQYKYRLHLKSDSLRHLELKALLPDSLNLPLLKSLDVSLHLKADMVFGLHYTHRPEEVLYSSQFEKLEELTFSQPSNGGVFTGTGTTNRPGYKLRFYQRLTRLKKLHIFEHKTSENIFLAICESCANLTELWIECLQILDPHALRHLSKLPNLRRLTVNAFVAPAPVSFASAHLPNLERLRLGCGAIAYDSFRALGTVKTLECAVTVVDEAEPLRAFARHLTELTVLELNFDAMRGLEPSATLQALHLLTTVQELVLEGGRFDATTCKPNTRPMTELKKLCFRRCWMHSRHLPWLHNVFPNLRAVDMRHCQFPSQP